MTASGSSRPAARAGPPSVGVATARGSLLVVAAAVLWGTTGTSQALGPPESTPLAVGALRLLIGGGTLAAIALRGRGSDQFAVLRGDRAALAGAVLGAVAVAAYQVTFFAAVAVAGVALGTAVTIGSGPVFAGVLETAVLRRPVTRSWAVATAIAAVGVGVLTGPSQIVPGGVALALAAGLSYAVFAVGAKRTLDAGVAVTTAMGVVFGLGGILVTPLLLPGLLAGELGWTLTPGGLAMIVWLGVAATALAYLLYGAGLRRLSVASAATLSLAEPVTAAVLGVVVVGERPGAAAATGAALIVAALVLLVRAGSAGSTR